MRYDMFFRTFLFLVNAILLGSGLAQSQWILKEFQAPGPESRGLAWDGQALWCADASHSKVYQLSPDDGHILFSFNYSMDNQYGGLGWSADGYLWVTDFREGTSWFDKVNPTSGELVSSFHCPGG